jgi:hypothetical protein
MTTVQGQFQHLIYSPRGSIEGILLSCDGDVAQIVFDKHDEESPLAFEHLAVSQTIAVEARMQGPSPHGAGENPVYNFERLLSIDGVKPARRRAASTAMYQGVVERLNFARHGAANGVVLDSGDFIHLKPDGMTRFGLKVGDRVEADGDAQLLATGKAWAVEANTVNGRDVTED